MRLSRDMQLPSISFYAFPFKISLTFYMHSVTYVFFFLFSFLSTKSEKRMDFKSEIRRQVNRLQSLGR